MRHRRSRRPPVPLTESKLNELALAYVGRYATSRAKLGAYLKRKLRERGWDGEIEPDVAVIAERFAIQGYVDDEGYALDKARSLAARGYGKRRVHQALRLAGIAECDGAAAREHSDREALSSALRFAEKRKIGPYASAPPAERKDREKAIAAMIRAGHGFDLARAIVALAPGVAIDLEELAHSARLTAA